MVRIVDKQGELPKTVKEGEEFFNHVDLTKLNIYFKIRLYKFLTKFPALENSSLSLSYFKSNLKVINKVCKKNVCLFGKKD